MELDTNEEQACSQCERIMGYDPNYVLKAPLNDDSFVFCSQACLIRFVIQKDLEA